MDGHPMTQGVIPIKHSSLPGLIKLPKRYEQAALGETGHYKNRKISVCASPLPLPEAVPDRISDLMTATLWVKQELILLRQHDILLKRQFFNIHHSIQTLQSSNSHLENTSHVPTTSFIPTKYDVRSCNLLDNTTSSTSFHSVSSAVNTNTQRVATYSNIYSNNQMETLLVRPSILVKIPSTMNDDSDDSTEGDVFFETEYYRPRTTSMRTSRDLAALARRRGSKDLI